MTYLGFLERLPHIQSVIMSLLMVNWRLDVSASANRCARSSRSCDARSSFSCSRSVSSNAVWWCRGERRSNQHDEHPWSLLTCGTWSRHKRRPQPDLRFCWSSTPGVETEESNQGTLLPSGSFCRNSLEPASGPTCC